MSGHTSSATVFEFHRKKRAWPSFICSWLTCAATFFILIVLGVILADIIYNGASQFNWRFLTGGTEHDMFNARHAGILPMIFGTAVRVLLMTVFVMPVGVITAIYLTEYAHSGSFFTRIIHTAVNNLAGVPSIIFGLFGLGFFINFIGQNMDAVLNPNTITPIWGKPALIWASMTLAVMTLPVVIVATQESLRAIPQGLREASLALGATKLETVVKIVLPQALPGIMTGAILAIGRAAGEVAPILFTGAAYYMASLPHSLHDQFMDLGYHVFILSTQSPNIDKTRPIAYATVLALLLLTFSLNAVAIIIRSRIRAKMRSLH
jgi:phosphate transport system permease protein